ncbi:uncharacterized protein Dwil_GK16078 [Drosophila willistoni]|uniref:Uncharacterized protein n=1 Tax=Drosophila willistoni TaxID=7260 RepID=A0A0Q9X387_DROWI|nr:uncharacterized protein Dwil_GK16078 [Drosophila willistoni]
MTTQISSEKYATLSLVIPIAHCGRQQIMKVICNTTTGNKLKTNLLAQFDRRFGGMEQSFLLAASTLLDPRFKRIHFQDALALASVMKNIRREMATIGHANESQDSVSDGSVSSEVEFDLWAHHKSLAHKRRKKEAEYTDVQDELSFFLNSPVLELKRNVIDAWEEMRSIKMGLDDVPSGSASSSAPWFYVTKRKATSSPEADRKKGAKVPANARTRHPSTDSMSTDSDSLGEMEPGEIRRSSAAGPASSTAANSNRFSLLAPTDNPVSGLNFEAEPAVAPSPATPKPPKIPPIFVFNCSKGNEQPPECVNCGESHAASYRGCRVYKEAKKLREQGQARSAPRTQNRAAPSPFMPHSFPSSFTQPGMSYAGVTKNSASASIPAENINAPSPLQQGGPTVAHIEQIIKLLQAQMEQMTKMMTSAELVNLRVGDVGAIGASDRGSDGGSDGSGGGGDAGAGPSFFAAFGKRQKAVAKPATANKTNTPNSSSNTTNPPKRKAEKRKRQYARKRGFRLGGVKLTYIKNKKEKLPQQEEESYAVAFFEEKPIYTINVKNEDDEVTATVVLDDADEKDTKANSERPSRTNGKRASKQLRMEWTTLHDSKDYKS